MDLHDLSDKTEEVSKKYAQKNGIMRDDDWFVFKLQEELGELTQKYLMMTDRARKKGLTNAEIRQDFDKEVADVFGQILLLSKHFILISNKKCKKSGLFGCRMKSWSADFYLSFLALDF